IGGAERRVQRCCLPRRAGCRGCRGARQRHAADDAAAGQDRRDRDPDRPVPGLAPVLGQVLAESWGLLLVAVAGILMPGTAGGHRPELLGGPVALRVAARGLVHVVHAMSLPVPPGTSGGGIWDFAGSWHRIYRLSDARFMTGTGGYIRWGNGTPSSDRPVERTRRARADSASLLSRRESDGACSTGHCSKNVVNALATSSWKAAS